MGLAISVTDFVSADDPEYQQHLDEQLQHINRLLKAQKLPLYESPMEVPKFRNRAGCQGFPYSWLHYLRRALAHARQQPKKKLKPVKGDFDPSEDPLIDNELSIHMDCHLICHSDCEGYYLPLDFSEPIYESKAMGKGIAGDIMGSSYAALRELVQCAPFIDIELKDGKPSTTLIKTINEEEDETHPFWLERKVWLALYEAMRLSIEHKLVVVYQ